jgi:hypothetical protein
MRISMSSGTPVVGQGDRLAKPRSRRGRRRKCSGWGAGSLLIALLLAAAVHDDARTVDRRVRLSQRGDDAVAAAFGGTEIDLQHLVFAMVDRFGQPEPAARQIGLRKLALEHRVLEVIAEATHDLVDLGEPLVLADVVRDEEGVAQVRRSPGLRYRRDDGRASALDPGRPPPGRGARHDFDQPPRRAAARNLENVSGCQGGDRSEVFLSPSREGGRHANEGVAVVAETIEST